MRIILKSDFHPGFILNKFYCLFASYFCLKHLAKLGDEGLVAQFAALSDRQDWLQYAKDCGIRRVDTVLDSVETVIVE